MSRDAENAIPAATACLDATGTIASLACAIHCALTPLIAAFLPLIGLGFLADEVTEFVLLGLSASLCIVSLCLGFLTHRSAQPFPLFLGGITLLGLGKFSESMEWGPTGVCLVISGGCALAAAHVFNQRLCRVCRKLRGSESHFVSSRRLVYLHSLDRNEPISKGADA